jgi:hypothetical protein
VPATAELTASTTRFSIGSQQDIESSGLGGGQQVAVLQSSPAFLRGCADLVSTKMGADRDGCGLVEEDPHLSRMFRHSIETANRKFDDGFDLFAVEPFVPLHDVVDVGTGFKVFKNG